METRMLNFGTVVKQPQAAKRFGTAVIPNKAQPMMAHAYQAMPLVDPMQRQMVLQSRGIKFAASQPVSPVANPMKSMFAPKAIAVVGASLSAGTIGNRVLSNLVTDGYTGAIYPVNPKFDGQSIPQGNGVSQLQPFVKDVSALPDGAVDMAVIMTPAKTVPDVVDKLGQKGVKSVVVISSGFSEVAGGSTIEKNLAQALDKHQMKMIGPNCVGIVSTDPTVRMNATFADTGIMNPGSGAVMSQSGAIGIDLINQAKWSGLGFHHVASIGNQSNTDSADLIENWAQDKNVKFIVGYLESIHNPDKFRQVASQVSKTKPILLIKSGRSDEGAKAASSHTGSLAGSDQAVDALFRQSGVHRINNIEELMVVAKAFESAKPLQGNRVGVLSNSGGYGVMLADQIKTDKLDLVMAKLDDATKDKLTQLLPPQASKDNPIDTSATTPADNLENYKKAMLATVQDPNIDALVVTVVPVLAIDAEKIARAISEVQDQTEKPIMAVLSIGEKDLLDIETKLKDEKKTLLPFYRELDHALLGLNELQKQRVWEQRPAGSTAHFPDVKPQVVKDIIAGLRKEGRKLMTTVESLNVLKAYGIPVPDFDLAHDKAQAMQLGQKIGYPLAIKFVSETITHKTDIGGVEIDIRTPQQLEAAYDRIAKNLAAKNIDLSQLSAKEGIMVQKFIEKGRETIIGLKEDPNFGKMIAFGLGGIYVETLKDVAFGLNSISTQDAKDMIGSLKMVGILKGLRGKPGVDMETLEETLMRFSQLVKDFPELHESDINPYFAQPKPAPGQKGGIAVDARFVLS